MNTDVSRVLNLDHQVRSLLTLILGNLDSALARSARDPDVHSRLRVAHRNALSLLRLIDDVRDMDSVKSDVLTPRLTSLDISERTTHLVNGFESVFRGLGIDLSIDIESLVPIYCDQDIWDKIVLTLLSTSLKFTFEGRVSISLKQASCGVVFTVSATCPAMPAGNNAIDEDRILSLSFDVVESLVKILHGSFSRSSSSELGSVLSVSVPYGLEGIVPEFPVRLSSNYSALDVFIADAYRWIDGLSGESKSPGIHLVDSVPTNKRCILVALDNLDLRGFVSSTLSKSYRVSYDTADDFSLIISDGCSFFNNSGVPVIHIVDRLDFGVVSGYPIVDDYVTQPFTAVELLARVRNAIDVSGILNEGKTLFRQAQRMEAVGKLTSGVAHDFANLMVSSVGSLDLASRLVSDDSVTRLISAAHTSSVRAIKLSSHLLSFSNGRSLASELVNVNDLISSISPLFIRCLGGDVNFSISLGKDIPNVFIDAADFELALLNLIINAKEALASRGGISLSTGWTEVDGRKYAIVSIADDGAGMDTNVVASSASQFFTTKFGSSGLGLSQVVDFASSCGGHVQISSEVGVGTQVTIYIPYAHDMVESSGTSVNFDFDHFIPKVSSALNVLIVDDDPDVLSTVSDMATELGCNVTSAPGGRAGIDILNGENFDLLIVDFAMSDVNGLDVANFASNNNPLMKIIFSTGYADISSLDANRFPVLQKPFGIRDLYIEISRALVN